MIKNSSGSVFAFPRLRIHSNEVLAKEAIVNASTEQRKANKFSNLLPANE